MAKKILGPQMFRSVQILLVAAALLSTALGLDISLSFDARPALGSATPASLWATGEMDNWSGWGTELKDSNKDGIYEGTFTGLSAGSSYQFVVLRAGNIWDDKIVPEGESINVYTPTLGVDFKTFPSLVAVGASCDFISSDMYNNYGFLASSISPSVSICSNCCATSSSPAPAPAPSTVDVYLYFDAKPSLTLLPSSLWATGDKDSWSGWGVELKDQDGDGIYVGKFDLLTPGTEYQFAVLPSGGGWSAKIAPPLGSSCDFAPSDSYNNYGFTASLNLNIHLRSDCSTYAPDWELVWNEDFSSWDPSTWTSSSFGDAPWTPDNNAWGGGNSELQFYTDRTPENIVVANGKLKIIGRQETFSGDDCPAFNFACSDSEKISGESERCAKRRALKAHSQENDFILRFIRESL